LVRKTGRSYVPAIRPDGSPFQAFVTRHSCGGVLGFATGHFSDHPDLQVEGWNHGRLL
jgi:hypothetical protein